MKLKSFFVKLKNFFLRIFEILKDLFWKFINFFRRLSKDKKRRIVPILLSGIVLILLIIGISYAYVSFTATGKGDNLIYSGCLKINFTETAGLKMLNAYPVTDEEGLNSEPYTFTIENICNTNAYYTATFNLINGSNLDNISKTKIALDGDATITPTFISELGDAILNETPVNTDATYLLSEGYLEKGQTKTFNLRMWIDYNVTNYEGIFDTKVIVDYRAVNTPNGEELANLDTSGANAPELATGMIPVYYDGSVWRKADYNNYDLDHKWYDYNNKQWANAVTVTQINGSRTDLINAPVGTIIPMDRINTMFVWIPRFDAVTPSNYNGGTLESPGAISVSFTNIAESSLDAFTFGEQSLSGFWVGKFKASSDIECTAKYTTVLGEACNLNSIKPLVKPNVTSWRGAQVSTFHTAMRAMEENKDFYGFDNVADSTLDTRVIKNNEWGAIAYLTQSIYGRCTDSVCTSLGMNPDFITGYGAPVNVKPTETGAYDTPLGMDASTTGNIYGVYDMATLKGDEVVMGVWGNSSIGYWSGYSENYNSGFNGYLGMTTEVIKTDGIEFFSIEENKKYFSSYSATEYYGHALNETERWYNNYSNRFAAFDSPWFVRGGITSGYYAGIFTYDSFSGYAYPDTATRPVLSK